MVEPTIQVDQLDAFSRSIEDVDSPVIKYPKLNQKATEVRSKEPQIWREFIDAEQDSIYEEDRARAAAIGYLILTAEQLQYAPERDKDEVSKRFTEATSELYGTPETAEVRRIIAEEYTEFAKLKNKTDIDRDRLQSVLNFYEQEYGGIPPETVKSNEDQSEILDKVREAFLDKFGEALKVFEDLDPDEELTPEHVKVLFAAAKAILEKNNPAWADQSIAFTDKKSMSYNARKQAIEIGDKTTYKGSRVPGLFIEEVLIHGQRSVNGATTGDYLMRFGMPGYLPAEEGLAKLIKLAMGGQEGTRADAYYLDTAFAMGLLGQPPKSRPEIAQLFIDKTILRHQAKGQTINEKKIHNTAWRHANRVFRGSLGNYHIGVNTNDIAYKAGYLKIVPYVKQKLQEGVDPSELLDYLVCGKIDPTNPRHEQHVSNLPTAAFLGYKRHKIF